MPDTVRLFIDIFFRKQRLLLILCFYVVVGLWVFLGFLCLYMLRVNLSVAIVAMTTPQSLKNQSAEACPAYTNESSDKPIKVRA